MNVTYTSLFAFCLDLVKEELLGLFVFYQLRVRDCDSVLCGPFLEHELVGDDDGDDEVLEGVTIDEDLMDIQGLS